MTDLLVEKINKIKMLIMDVDGVWTDGGLYLDNNGIESKKFDVQDGHGIRMLQRAGYKTVIITGKDSNIVKIRACHLEIDYVFQGCIKKLPVFEQILKDTGLKAEEVAYVGDDLLDLALVKRAGFGVAVANAVDEVKDEADYITAKPGGSGAVREVTDLILKTAGKWSKQMQPYDI